jgi:hypothetical protein
LTVAPASPYFVNLSKPIRILIVLFAMTALHPRASAQPQSQSAPQIDYHQHLLMPTDENPRGFLASDLIQLLDDAHIPRALVLSMAYRYGNPNHPPVADEYAHVKAENDWVSAQIAQYPDRLRGFCGVDPLKSYALAEIDRCALDPPATTCNSKPPPQSLKPSKTLSPPPATPTKNSDGALGVRPRFVKVGFTVSWD